LMQVAIGGNVKDRIKIKIYHEKYSNKPVFLHHNGTVVCGKFQYQGVHKREFDEYYGEIIHRACAYKSPVKNILDVSKSVIWDAPTICDRIIDPNAQNTISAARMYKLACETEVKILVEKIMSVFKLSVHSKWSKIHRKAAADPSTPKVPWQIL
jgi:hypothetical protein